VNAGCGQAACLVETQANVYERFLSGMMAKDKKDKKHEEKSEQRDEDGEDSSGWSVILYNVLCQFMLPASIKTHFCLWKLLAVIKHLNSMFYYSTVH